MAGIGLEVGPLSQWLFAALEAAGLPAVPLETRHVRTAFKTMPVKTDRKDAREIAQLMRPGWFRPVHCKAGALQVGLGAGDARPADVAQAAAGQAP